MNMKVPMQVPLFGQRPPSPSPTQMAQQLQNTINQLAAGIYVQLAAGAIARLEEQQELDAESLRKTAGNCRLAAKCYFESLGLKVESSSQEER